MTNFIETELPLFNLLYDIIKDLNKKEDRITLKEYGKVFERSTGDIYDSFCEEFNIELRISDVEKIIAYSVARRRVHRTYKRNFKDKSDILLLETNRVLTKGIKINEIPF